ncbi:hypothetical protein AC578_2466 [Pseudocercospora eumusae]|uniref:Major facilitator superfamily (MFS) profile domain-containing protein n=1 Tax=Pseudocercospora eumusae TaxID=321146 RepID=A0A139HXB1_9PEZI|nr:hypothetical protein AC578_2466 [Pseudocercospora eumusae]
MTVTTTVADQNEQRTEPSSLQSDQSRHGSDTETVPQSAHSTPNDNQSASGNQTFTENNEDSYTKEGASETSTHNEKVTSLKSQASTDNDKDLQNKPEASDKSSSTQPPQSGASVLLTLAICLVVFLNSLDRTVLTTAVPKITDDFHSIKDIGWYASAFMFANSCLLLPLGKIYTFYSPKWVYLICIGVFEMGSLICGLAPSSAVFIGGRAIAGAGAAGTVVGGYTLLFCVLPLHKRPWYNGVIGGVMGVSAATGPLIGGAFTTSVSWRWCFLVNLPIGGIAMLIVVLFLRPPPAVQAGLNVRQQLALLDLLGESLLIPSMICLILALHWGGAQYRWSDGRVIAVLVTFAVTLVAFGLVQMLYPDTATIPPRLAKNRSIMAGMIFEACISATLMVFLWCIPLWFQNIKDATAMRSGINTIPILISFCTGSVVSGLVVGRIGYYTPVAIVGSAITATGAGLIVLWKTTTSVVETSGYQIVLGLGLGLGFQQGSMAAQTVLLPSDIPTGLAIMNIIQQLSGAVFVCIGYNLLKTSLIHKLGAVVHDYINPQLIINTGATEFRRLVPQQDLPRALAAYNSALRQAFLLGFIVACTSALGSCLLEWRSVKGDQGPKKENVQAEEVSSRKY